MIKFFIPVSIMLSGISVFASSVETPKTQDNQVRLLKACQEPSPIIDFMETKHKIPKGLLKAIAKVESRCHPWTINVQGRPYVFDSKTDALRFIRYQLSIGVKWFDAGCMQIHYRSHFQQFKDLAHMIDPFVNIEYAAKFLNELKLRFGSWEKAVKNYHSSLPEYQMRYMYKINNEWKGVSSAIKNTYGFQSVVYKPAYLALKNKKASQQVKSEQVKIA